MGWKIARKNPGTGSMEALQQVGEVLAFGTGKETKCQVVHWI